MRGDGVAAVGSTGRARRTGRVTCTAHTDACNVGVRRAANHTGITCSSHARRLTTFPTRLSSLVGDAHRRRSPATLLVAFEPLTPGGIEAGHVVRQRGARCEHALDGGASGRLVGETRDER